MNLYRCFDCANYWANNVLPTLLLFINRVCPDCIARLPKVTPAELAA